MQISTKVVDVPAHLRLSSPLAVFLHRSPVRGKGAGGIAQRTPQRRAGLFKKLRERTSRSSSRLSARPGRF